MEESNFINSYKEQMLNTLYKKFPYKAQYEIENILDEMIDESLNEPDCIFDNDYNNTSMETSLLSVLDHLMDNKELLTGFGCIYKQPDTAKNLVTDMLNYLLTERGKVKEQMFEAKRDGKEELAKALDRLQGSVIKLLANAFYGVAGMPTSQFYNNRVAASVTYTGVQIITHSMMSFERFLSNNVKFNNVDELLVFMSNVIEDTEYSINDVIDDDKFIDDDTLLEYVYDLLKDTDNFDMVKDYTFHLDDEDRNLIYYKNNIYKFIDACEYARTYLDNVVGKEFLDAGNASENISENLDGLWELLDIFVYYDYAIYDRYDRAINDKRETILAVDTDSNFVNMDPWYKFIDERYDIDENRETMISVSNIGIYYLTHFIDKALNRFTENCNLKEDKRPIINMKNEYLYETLMTTENKKQYVGSLLSREGVMLDPPKTDIKGLSIKKSNVNKKAQNVFTSVIEDEILSNSGDISLSRVIKKFKEFEDDVHESLLKGEMTFTTPSKVNSPSSYAYPTRMAVLRGTIIHNELFPNDPIAPPEKINLLKLSAKKLEDIDDLLENGHEKEHAIIKNCIFNINDNGDEIDSSFDASRFGFTTIVFPKNVKEIPEWIRPYIAIEEIVGDNIRNGLIILKSLGLKELKLTDQKTYYSNIVNF